MRSTVPARAPPRAAPPPRPCPGAPPRPWASSRPAMPATSTATHASDVVVFTRVSSTGAVGTVDPLEHAFRWRQTFFLRFRRGLLVRPLGEQGVTHRQVSFVAGVLVNLVIRLLPHRQPHRPRAGERQVIVEGDHVVTDLRVDAGETLGGTKRGAVRGAADGRPVGEVRRFDDQRVALPVTAGVAHPELDARAEPRTSIE